MLGGACAEGAVPGCDVAHGVRLAAVQLEGANMAGEADDDGYHRLRGGDALSDAVLLVAAALFLS